MSNLLSRLKKPHKGPLKKSQNPKLYLLKAIKAQRSKPTWVKKETNTIRVNCGAAILFPVMEGSKEVSLVWDGNDDGKDYTDPQQYGGFLTELEADVNSGAMDSYIDAWGKK